MLTTERVTSLPSVSIPFVSSAIRAFLASGLIVSTTEVTSAFDSVSVITAASSLEIASDTSTFVSSAEPVSTVGLSDGVSGSSVIFSTTLIFKNLPGRTSNVSEPYSTVLKAIPKPEMSPLPPPNMPRILDA